MNRPMESRVKEWMESRGVTIRALAEETGLSTHTIKRARDNRIRLCTLKTLQAIAAALGVAVKDLFVE